ncbi:MAG: DUF3086 domain-containing protein [Phormidesmis sp. RL_2_1]|nr:DUF3086 domain-containing protein [Phormidesmis sp. RL_2_1]
MPPEDSPSSDSSFSGNAESVDRSATGGSVPVPLSLQRSASGGQSVGGQSVGGQRDIIEQLVREGLRDLESRRRNLQQEVDQLERRKQRLEAEMRASFAGASQEMAIRVQGFKDYLVGSLQDLVTAAEEMNLSSARPDSQVMPVTAVAASSGDRQAETLSDGSPVPFAAQRFAEQRDRVNSLLDQYRTRPDYYGPPWQLRRTFEPVHAERTSNWFFTQGGRGSVKSMGSRLQNVLIASAAISCLYAIYDRRLCVLVLATTPERVGEWRRWLQDCLGIAREDFGTNRGVMLFEASEPMAQRADRLLDNGRLPFLIMDEAEDKVSLSLLQYPLWLGFAPDPEMPATDYDYY